MLSEVCRRSPGRTLLLRQMSKGPVLDTNTAAAIVLCSLDCHIFYRERTSVVAGNDGLQ